MIPAWPSSSRWLRLPSRRPRAPPTTRRRKSQSRRSSRTTPRSPKPPIEALKAIRSFRVPEGLKVELFAAEPMLANPVAFCFDEKGVAYVAETFRLNEGVTDTRGHMDWLDDDLACRTVADRVAMYKKYLGSKFESFRRAARPRQATRRSRRRRPGRRMPRSSPTASTTRPSGIGAGVLARKGDVWYTCIPGPLEAARHQRRRPRRRAQAAARRLRRSRRVSGPRPPRAQVRARRQTLLQHRRPRLQRDDLRRQEARRARYRLGPALRARRHRARGLCHRPAQPAGAGVRSVRQSLHRRQQFR